METDPSPRTPVVLGLTSSLLRWLNPLMGKGSGKDLEIEDIYAHLKEDSSEDLGEQLQK